MSVVAIVNFFQHTVSKAFASGVLWATLRLLANEVVGIIKAKVQPQAGITEQGSTEADRACIANEVKLTHSNN